MPAPVFAQDDSARLVSVTDACSIVQVVVARPRVPPAATKKELVARLRHELPAYWSEGHVFLRPSSEGPIEPQPVTLAAEGVRFVALLEQLAPEDPLPAYRAAYELAVSSRVEPGQRLVLEYPDGSFTAPRIQGSTFELARQADPSSEIAVLLAEWQTDAELAEVVAEILNRVRAYSGKWPLESAEKILKELSDLNRPAYVVAIADAFMEHGLHAESLRRRRAQALVNTGRITEAIAMLAALEAELETPDAEKIHGEVLGQLGRCYKQLYVDARPNAAEPRTADYQAAHEYYRRGYLADEKRFWHGINIAALAAHRRRLLDRGAGLPEEARAIIDQFLSSHDLQASDAGGIL